MRCPIETEENAEILLEYCARRLDPETAAVLERHIKVCPACQSFQESQQMVWEALDTWEAQPISADFDRKLFARIEAEGSSWWQRLIRPFEPALLRQGLPIAVAACLLMMAGVIAQRPNEPAAPVLTVVRAETVPAEQVERTLDDMELLREFTVATRNEKVAPGSM